MQLSLPHDPSLPGQAARLARTGRSRHLPALLSFLCHRAPALASSLAFRLLAAPGRPALRGWQEQLRKEARGSAVQLAAGRVAVYEWGRGPAVLLVHGWGSHAMHMGRMVKPLVDAGLRVVAFDAPAHGQSSGRDTDFIQFAAAIAAVARATGPLRCVVGHSFGAAMSAYAMRDWGIETQRLVMLSAFTHCNWFLDSFARELSLTDEVTQRLREEMVNRYGGRLDWSRLSVLDMLRQVECPTLVLHDQDDPEVPFEHGLALAGASPRTIFRATRGQGHHMILRSAGTISQLVQFATA